MKKINYNKDYCVNEALKYNNRTDFHKNSSAVYNIARINNWLNDICSHMTEIIKPNYYWNYNKCANEALKYNKRVDFRKKSSGAYNAARINGWLDDICLHMMKYSEPHGYWTKEKCQALALKYNTKQKFSQLDNVAYKMAHKKGWIDDICSHMQVIGNRYNRCIYSYEFPDNHVYIGLTYNPDVRNNFRKYNKRDQVTKYIKISGLKPKFMQLTDYILIDEASKLEIFYVEKYKKDGWIILNKIKAGGLGGGNLIWTYDKIKEEALKYNSRYDFRKNAGGAYAAASLNGWLFDVCSHIKRTRKPKKIN